MAEKSGGSLDPVLAKLNSDSLKPNPPYDSDAFDSMAVMNSEIWNEGQSDEGGLTRADILPHGVSGLGPEQVREAFLKAAQCGVLDVVKELHQLCGDDIIHTRDADQYTALHRASYNGHLEVVEYLLRVGAKVDARTVDGWQPLHCACRWNKTPVASLLLQNGAIINAQTNGKQTPLHLAACNNYAKNTLILLLSDPKIDPSLRNSQNNTALEVAERCGTYGYLFELVEESVDHRRFLPVEGVREEVGEEEADMEVGQ